MKKIFLFVVLGILLANFVFAFTLEEAWEMDGKTVPGATKYLVGNQKINIYLDDNFFVAADTTNNIIVMQNEKFEEPSLEIYVNSSVVDRIKNSADPTEEALKAYRNGEIKLVKIGIMNKLKFGIASIGVRIWSWFS